MKKSIFEKINYDVISVTSSLLRHRNTSRTNVSRFLHFGPLPIKISGCASGPEQREWIGNGIGTRRSKLVSVGETLEPKESRVNGDR